MTPANPGQGRDRPLCGGHRRDGTGGTCRRPAGWGTSHPGTGPCKLHGGSTPNHVRAAQREMAAAAVATYGLPREVEPAQALLELVHVTAGHVAWLAALVAELQHDGDGYERVEDDDGRVTYRPRSGLKQLDASGKFEKPSVWVELYGQERDRLARVAKSAIDAGIAERQVRLAEQQGELLAGVIRRVLDALDLSPTQAALVPVVVPRELRALTAGSAA